MHTTTIHTHTCPLYTHPMDSYYRLQYGHFCPMPSLYCEGECQTVGNHRVVTTPDINLTWPNSISHNSCMHAFPSVLSVITRLSVTTKTFCGNKTAKAALPLRCRLICQGVLPLSMSSGPLLSMDVREEGIVKCYCQDRQETRLGLSETLKESLSTKRS